MPTNIEMPKLSDTMTEGTLVKWNKQVGDTIEIGDVIAEVETDKATMEMEAFDEGTLSDILVQAGEKAAVGATLGVLLEDGEEAPAPGSAPAAISAPESQPFAEGAEGAEGPKLLKLASQPPSLLLPLQLLRYIRLVLVSALKRHLLHEKLQIPRVWTSLRFKDLVLVEGSSRLMLRLLLRVVAHLHAWRVLQLRLLLPQKPRSFNQHQHQ